MKARRVKGLDPAGPLADQLERIVLVRLDELCGFWPRVTDPREVEALHDMRIAAKRLRYLLEVSDGLFGPYAEKAVKRLVSNPPPASQRRALSLSAMRSISNRHVDRACAFAFVN